MEITIKYNPDNAEEIVRAQILLEHRKFYDCLTTIVEFLEVQKNKHEEVLNNVQKIIETFEIQEYLK